MAEVVGTAYVRIRAVTTRLASDIADGVKRGSENAKPDIEVAGKDVGDFWSSSMLDQVKNKVGQNLSGIFQNYGKDSGQSFTDKFGNKLRSGIRALDGDDRSSGFFRRFGSSLSGIFHRAWRARSESEGKSTLSSLQNSFKKIFKSLQKFKLPLPFWLPMFGLGLIAGAAKLVTFYIGGLVGYIGTLLEISVAAGAALGVAFLQLVTGFGLIMAAFKAQTPELEAFKEGLKSINAEWKEVARATQRELFPGITDAYRTLSTGLIPVFNELAPVIGRIGGDMARTVTAILTSERAINMWRGFSMGVAATTQNFGRLIAAIAEMLIPLFEVLNPIAVDFSDTLATTFERWSDILDASKQSGKLTKFFETSYDSAMKFFGAVGDLFAALWNVFRLGSQELGMSAFDTFDRFAERFRTFTNSLDGQNKIRKFFQEAKPVMEEVHGLISDIFRAFGRSIDQGTGSQNIVSFLQTLRTEILPVLEVALTNMSRAMDNVNFEEFLVTITELLTAIFEIQMLTPILQTVTWIINRLVDVLNIPIVGDLIRYLFIAGTVAGFAKSFLSPVVGLISGIGTVSKWAAPYVKAFAIQLAAVSRAAAVSSLAGIGKVLAVIGTVLASLASGPVLIVVGVIAAIAAAIAGLYFAFDGVRNVVDGFWESIQKVWDILTNFSFDRLGELALAAMEVITRAVTFFPSIAWEALWGLGELLVKFASNIPGWLATAASALWEWIQGAVPVALEWLGSFASSVLEWVMGLPGKIWEFMQLAIPKLFEWIQNAIPQVLYWLGYALGFIIGWAVRIPLTLTALLIQAAQALWQWIVNAVPVVLEFLGSLASSVWGWVTGFISELPGRIWGAAVAIWDWIVQAIPQVLMFLGELAGNVWNWVTGFIADLPGKIRAAIPAILNWVSDAASELPYKLAVFAIKLTDWARDLPGKIIGAIGDIGGKMIDVGKAVVEGIWNGITNMGQWILDRIGDFAGGVFEGFKSAFGINSPAKMMIPIGVGVAEGVGLGMRKEWPSIEKQINQSVADVYAAASGVSRINTGSSMSPSAAVADAIRLLATTANTDVRVFIGERELTDIVDTQVDKNNRAQATLLLGRSG